MKGDVNSLPPTARAREKPAVLSWRARSGPARGVSPERRASGPTIPLTRLAMAKIERKDDSWQKPALRHIVMPARRESRKKADGRYAVGFFLRLPARSPVPSRCRQACIGMLNERLTERSGRS
jgi:hypothetical protein